MSAPHDPLLGRTLGGYRLAELLGRGAAGSVYRAEKDGASWAVKVLHDAADGRAAARLRREAEVGARVRHPNVARVVGLGGEDGLLFLAREYVDGVSLDRCLRPASRLTISDAVGVAVQVLHALAAAHEKGVVHRDLKPVNVLLARLSGGEPPPAPGARFVAKLFDFSIARVEGLPDDVGGEGQVTGTPAYMPPEQWQDAACVDGRADVYALGCVLFEMLSGQRPFGAASLEGLLYQHANNLRPDPADYCAAPAELSGLVRRMMAMDPGDRPADLPALAADLAATLEGMTAQGSGVEEVLAEHAARTRPAPGPAGEAETPHSTTPERSAASEAPTRDVPAPATPAHGEPLLGDYRVGEVVWRDSFSSIQRATDVTLDVEVAVEVMLPGWEGQPELVERFRRRARAAALVDHPNVLRVFAFHRPPGHPPYCVLEACRGRTLADYLQENRERAPGLPFEEVLDVAEQALHGLHALHAEGLVHRDLKPRNLFLKEMSGRPWLLKLTGFHLVKETSADAVLTHEGAVMGTVSYIAPEVVNGGAGHATGRSDLYSLGCVLFEAACGRLPFAGGTSHEILVRIVHEAPPDPASLRPDLPRPLCDLILRLMAKDPADRYAGAAEALGAVARVRAALARPAEDTAAEAEAATAVAPRPRPAPPPRSEDQAFSSEVVVTHYPAPVALAYRRFCRQADPRTRLDRLFFTAEAALRYLVTLGVCDLFQCLAGPGAEALELPAHQAFDFLRRPRAMQLGMWAEALRETARALAGQPGRLVKELPEACAPGGRLDGQLVAGLVACRNRVAHPGGGIAATPDESEAAAREVRPLLDELLREVQFVRDYPLGFVQKGLDLGRPGGQGQGYYLHSCMGAVVENTNQAYYLKTDAALREMVPFVVAGGGARLLYLWPLLLHRVSPLSERHTLYAFEALPDRNWPYLTCTTSSAIDVREEWRQALHAQGAASHAWLLGPLGELRSASDVPAELGIHQKLMPWRGGALAGLKLDGILLHAPVGRGGFGTIYAATAPDGGRVAVKVLESAAVSPRQVKRFQQEFERLRRLDAHPGIIRTFQMSVLLLDGRVYPWYSMEFALGGDLGGRIEERRAGPAGPLPWADGELRRHIAAEFRQVVAAVAHLHERHLIHRDLKPSNVLVMEDGSLRLSDFGLAKNLEPSEHSLRQGPVTSAGAVMGTRYYMAPEQERGQDVAEPADVYALGILLAEMAAGARPQPNTGVSSGSTLQGWRKANGLPEPLRRFVQRLTDAAPDRRPPDAAAVAREFEGLLG
jgi:serine/threonine-protein kinase